MTDAHWWLVSYDVCDPQRLRKTAKLVEGYGCRIQFSVFRCWLTSRELEKLRWELTELLTTEDNVLLIPICSRCVIGVRGIHRADRPPDWPSEPPRFQIV